MFAIIDKGLDVQRELPSFRGPRQSETGLTNSPFVTLLSLIFSLGMGIILLCALTWIVGKKRTLRS